jgi:iron complex transport system substrate-binding protein
MRVISVLPSATEIVGALGHLGDLVGRSAECDYPTEVRSLPVVMAPRHWDSDAPSGSIDARVSAARANGESLYTLNVDLLRELRPDVLFTQDLCGVCSVTGEEVAQACERASVRPEVVSLTPRGLSDVWDSVEVVARALGDPLPGRRLADELRARARPTERAHSPSVAVLEWLDPPLLAGLWTPEMIGAAGGRALGTRAGAPGVRTTWESVGAGSPDLVVVSPCSFSVDRTRRELEDPSVRAALASLHPPLGTHVADEAYFSRPGPRLADGVDLLRHLLSRDAWRPPMPVRTLEQLGLPA